MIDLHNLSTQQLGKIKSNGLEHKIKRDSNGSVCPVTEPWWSMVGRIFLECIAESDSEYVRSTILYPLGGPWVSGHVFMGIDRGTIDITDDIPECILDAHYITEVHAIKITFRFTCISKTALKWFEIEHFDGWCVSSLKTSVHRLPNEIADFLIDLADENLTGIRQIITHTLQHASKGTNR